MPAITQKQRAILDFIAVTVDANGAPPTLREIAKHFGFRSKTAAADHVHALREKGFLAGAGNRRARGLRLPTNQRRRSWDIPIFGAIPAGFPDDRYQDSQGCVSVDLSTLGIHPTPRTFALKVRGDSMIGRHICDGDIVVLEHGRTPRSGDIVAALIDNENTLKTFVQERGKPPHLKSENPKYPRLHPATELVIQGVMMALLRKAS